MSCHKQIVVNSKLLKSRVKCANDFENRLKRLSFPEDSIAHCRSNFENAISNLQSASEMRKKLTEWIKSMKKPGFARQAIESNPKPKPRRRIVFEIEIQSEEEEAVAEPEPEAEVEAEIEIEMIEVENKNKNKKI